MNSLCPITNEHGFCTLPDSHDPETEPHVFGTEFDEWTEQNDAIVDRYAAPEDYLYLPRTAL